MRPRQASLAACALCILALACPLLVDSATSTASINQKALKRSDAKRWKDQATRFKKNVIPSKSKSFLSNRGQDLSVPLAIDVMLSGFDGQGAYQYTLDPQVLEQLLQTSFFEYCPSIWDTKEQASVCFYITFNVINLSDYQQTVQSLELQIQHNMKPVDEADPAVPGGEHPSPPDPQNSKSPKFQVNARDLEPWFSAALQTVYSGDDDTGSKHWHKHNAIFIVNPFKPRMAPTALNVTGASKEPLNITSEWQKGHFDKAVYDQQEGMYDYHYTYNGYGAASTWLSSENYVVIDLSAGPTKFGPVNSPSGGADSKSLPRLRDIFEDILNQLRVEQTMTALEDMVSRAVAGTHTIFMGQLAGNIQAAAKHVFMPDVAHEQIEYSERVLVPIIVLRDHDQVDPLHADPEGDSEFYIDLDAINHAVKQITGVDQKAVITSTSFYLHHHPHLLAAIHKSMHTESEMHWEGTGGTQGVHMQLSTYLHAATLLDEFQLAADTLAYGLFEDEPEDENYNWEVVHDLRHRGTRTIPVFVLSMMHAPENLLFNNKELYAANEEAVVVLQLTDPMDQHGSYTGGAFTGHLLNGERVVVDVHNPTRHIVAGLATAIAGIVPPYAHFDPAHEVVAYDWLWAVGASPFGPYTSYSGLSSQVSVIAARNILLSHIEAAVRKAEGAQSRLDKLVAEHLQSPMQAALEDSGPQTHYLEFLHEKAKAGATQRGFNTTLTPSVVDDLEALLMKVDDHLSSIILAMYDHRFQEVDKHVVALHTAVDRYERHVDDVISEADELLECCAILQHPESMVSPGGMIGGAIVFIAVSGLMVLLALTRPAVPKKRADRRTSRGILG